MSTNDKIMQVLRDGGGDASSFGASRSYIKNTVSNWNAFNDVKFSVKFDNDKILLLKKPSKKIQNGYVKIATQLLKKVKLGQSIESELSSLQGYRSEEWTPVLNATALHRDRPLSEMPIMDPKPAESSDPYDSVMNYHE